MGSDHENDRVESAPQATEGQALEAGVLRAEAAHQVFGRYSIWLLYVGLGLSSYIYSLDSQTTWSYLAVATSAFTEHSLLASVEVAKQVIIACGKPVIAKIADVESRVTAYIFVLISYVVGYIVIASAQSVGAIAGGSIIYAVGYTGLQLLTQIIIADITSLKWRGLVSALMSAPFIVNAFIGSEISAAIINKGPDSWRWGYGMFAILVPVALSPLILTLAWAQRKAAKLHPVLSSEVSQGSIVSRAWNFCIAIDIFGLLLLAGGLACILISLTLAGKQPDGWHTPSMIALIVVSFVILGIFAVFEIKFSPKPVISPRFMKNKAIVGASIIGFFDFVSFYLTFLYLWSFVYVVQGWETRLLNYFTSTQSVALTVFAIIGGLVMRATQRYKWLLTAGLCIRLLGVGIMIHSRGAAGGTVELVFTQVIQGLGGGIAAVTSQVGAQASVTHTDVAVVTAIVLLFTEIGGAVGSAVAGAIWTNYMPANLEKYLPDATPEKRAELFGSVFSAGALPRGDPIREGVILAYDDTMKVLLITATCISVIPIIASLFMPDWRLTDAQNAIDERDVSGKAVADDFSEDDSHLHKKTSSD